MVQGTVDTGTFPSLTMMLVMMMMMILVINTTNTLGTLSGRVAIVYMSLVDHTLICTQWTEQYHQSVEGSELQ